MSATLAALLALSVSASAPPPPSDDLLRRADNSITGLNVGKGLTYVSIYMIPGVYDLGMLTMMGSKKSLKNLYVERYNEQPEDFGQSGDAAYGWGWAMKAGAVGSLFVVPQVTEEPMWAVFTFGILWLGGTFKHYEASRLLYDQARHYENGIRDREPPVLETAPPGPAGLAKPVGVKMAFGF